MAIVTVPLSLLSVISAETPVTGAWTPPMTPEVVTDTALLAEVATLVMLLATTWTPKVPVALVVLIVPELSTVIWPPLVLAA